ncbi:putative toxin-antitoxin system toxin component, PIN family [Candidatus Woesebacteria bacterium RIFCSPHIGHO2_01_FULL_38_9]|uniref:Putative toxin-antitoxin system toxin component, PIN family n=2 Tax=Candidatus Woeseibacteriota TaxID=1752722 RepID=A0A1F7Y092_9BACT|nr:MAG: putative toxin-antitoxin system toxin component, PIN family [Candidatus Woesebacteria bacterium RIFCSPHIGHO2_01_FULL_38_9]OGM63911.1 MAG: putative toxin-antitoxin system toxin component, PIN family [Candidatus Woesebacteria bacterium RIFCSPLOWO2_01_FULL_39_25]
MARIQVFLDTDVIISALLSQKGASFEIVNNPNIKKVISKTIEEELNEVIKRQGIKKEKTITEGFKTISLGLTKEKLLESYQELVIDEKDTHVITGAHKSGSKFLLTHNTKHYKSDEIKNRLDISVLKPGNFLQYLRSQKENK